MGGSDTAGSACNPERSTGYAVEYPSSFCWRETLSITATETLKESLLDSAEQGLGSIGSTENPISDQFLEGLSVQGFDRNVASQSLAQLEAILFGFSVDKESDRVFLENRTIFSDGSRAGTFWATAGEVKPSLSLPSELEPYAFKFQVAQHLNDSTQLKDMEEGILTALSQIEQIQLGELARKVWLFCYHRFQSMSRSS